MNQFFFLIPARILTYSFYQDGVLHGIELKHFVAFNFDKSIDEVSDDETKSIPGVVDGVMSCDAFKDLFLNGNLKVFFDWNGDFGTHHFFSH